MSTVLITIAAVACVFALTAREPGDDARTPAQIWAPARAHRPCRAVLLGLGGTAKLLLLLAAALAAMSFAVVAKACEVLVVVCLALAWQLHTVAAHAADPARALEAS